MYDNICNIRVVTKYKMINNLFTLLPLYLPLAYGSAYTAPLGPHSSYSSSRQEPQVMGTPQFLTSPLTLMINEGEIIRLPCKVNRLEGFVMLWKKDKNIITVGEQIIDKRVSLESHHDGTTLVIGQAQPQDQADYTCQISAFKPTEITHTVKIRVSPVVSVTPEKLVVNEGDPAAFYCALEAGRPAPQVIWRRRGHPMPNGEETLSNNNLTFTKVTRHDSGHYMCEADNGFSDTPVYKTVRLEVHHVPHVEPLSSQLISGVTREEKLVCVVHSDPRAVVTWSRNGEPIDSDTNGIEIESQGNTHSLRIQNVEEGHLGQYACHAVNVYGTDSKEIEISGLSKAPKYTSSTISPHRDSYTLAWSTQSHSPVSSFRVSYKESRSPSWITMEVSPSPSSGSSTWLGTALLSQLTEATQYEVRVQSRNQFGLSKLGEVFYFATKGAVPFHQPSTSSSSHIYCLSHILVTLLVTITLSTFT